MSLRTPRRGLVSLVLLAVSLGGALAAESEQPESTPSLHDILRTWSSESVGSPAAVRQLVDFSRNNIRNRGPNPQTREARILRRLAGDTVEIYVPVISLHSYAHYLALRRRELKVATYLRMETTRLIEEYMSKLRSQAAWDIGARFYMTLALPLRDGADLRLALKLLEEGLDTDPLNPNVLYAAAAIREKLGHYSSASDLFRRLLAVSADPEIELRLALCQARSGKSKVALRGLESVVRNVGPDWVRALAYQEWSQLLLKTGDPRMALTVAREGRDSLPGNEALRILFAFMAGPRDPQTRDDIQSLTSEPSGSGPTPRSHYNTWPSGAEDNARFLAGAVAQRMPLLVAALEAHAQQMPGAPEPNSP